MTGVVTDKETGKPLAGVLVEMIPSTMRNRYGGNYPVLARTDASGRYRAAGAAGETYRGCRLPRSRVGLSLGRGTKRNEWPAGAKVLEIDLALPKSEGRHSPRPGRRGRIRPAGRRSERRL